MFTVTFVSAPPGLRPLYATYEVSADTVARIRIAQEHDQNVRQIATALFNVAGPRDALVVLEAARRR